MVLFSDKFQSALRLAMDVHNGQIRKNGYPVISHPLSVAYIISRAFPNDENLICATVLHDVVEDSKGTPVTLSDIKDIFGEDVYQLVASVTEEKDANLTWEQHKYGTIEKMNSMSKRQIALKAADTYHNVKDLVYDLDNGNDFMKDSFKRAFFKRVDVYQKIYDKTEELFPELPFLNEFKDAINKISNYL